MEESMNDILEKVRSFTDQAHGDQQRKYSKERYIVHPVRVMETCREYTEELPVLAAALLHDVLEDTPVSREEIRKFLDTTMGPEQSLKTLKLVEELTDIYTKKDYPMLNRRSRKAREVERLAHVSEEAQLIKYADIMDNATNIFIHDPDFAMVYLHEGRALLKRMNKGNPELYDRAVKTVDDCLELLENKEEII
jgi:(p)ppGpp synthase/HD superfamily hydrolase